MSEFAGDDPNALAFTRRVRSLAREVSRSGSTVVVTSPEGVRLVAEAGAIKEVHQGPRAPRLRTSGFVITQTISQLLYSFALLRFIRRETPDSVAVMFHDPRLGLLSTLAARFVSGRVVFDAHDSWILLSTTHAGGLRNRIRRKLERMAFRSCDEVTTVSPSLKRLIEQNYRMDVSRVSVVRNGADIPQVLPKAEKDIDIIHLGGPRMYYDTPTFLKALAAVRDSGLSPTVVFLGTRDEEYARRAREETIRLGLEKTVRFLPAVSHDEVGSWLARSKIAVFTMWSVHVSGSNLALKLFEYMAYGLPVAHLGPPGTEVSNLITSQGTGLVASDAEGFSKVLIRLLTDAGLREFLGAKGREVSGEYSWERSGRKMAEVLGVTLRSD